MKKTISRNMKSPESKKFWLAMEEFRKDRTHVLSEERRKWAFEANGKASESKPRPSPRRKTDR